VVYFASLIQIAVKLWLRRARSSFERWLLIGLHVRQVAYGVVGVVADMIIVISDPGIGLRQRRLLSLCSVLCNVLLKACGC